MEKEDLIIGLLKESRDTQKKDSSDISAIKSDIAAMKVDVEANKDDLKEHMAQTRAVKSLTLDIRREASEKIELLKAQLNSDIADINKKLTVGYLFKLIVSVAASISVITGAIYGITRLVS